MMEEFVALEIEKQQKIVAGYQHVLKTVRADQTAVAYYEMGRLDGLMAAQQMFHGNNPNAVTGGDKKLIAGESE